MEAVGDILPRALHKHVLRGKQPAIDVLGPLWPRVVGKLIGANSKPVHFEDGVLTVAACSTTWASQLRGMADAIRAQVNGSLGAPVVKGIRFQADLRNYLKEPSADGSSAAAATPETLPEFSREDAPWKTSGVRLAPEIAEVMERSFKKYFSRNGRGPVA